MAIDDIFDYIENLSQQPELEGVDDLHLLQRYFKSVCPVSLFSNEDFKWIDLQEMCETYHKLPFEGALMEQPLLILDILSAVMEGKAMYQADYMKKLQEKSGS